MYSAAFNSFDHLSGSADPNTGTYSFKETIGPVQADGQFGPKCNLIMSYSLLSTMSTMNVTGLGRGWSFRLGNYISKSNMLTLNTGASYVVLDASPSHKWTLSHKLKSICVEQKGNEIHILHKNGDLEVMEMNQLPDTRDAVLKHFTSANGRFLKFNYLPFNGYNRLTEVCDNNHILAKVTYNDNDNQTIITTHPNTPDAKTTTLYMAPGGLLDKIETDDEYISFSYHKFDYNNSQVALYPIECVKYSNGASEEMEYNEKLHLPTHAPIPYTPGITKHTKITATDQPPIITTFTYRDEDGQAANNYWGYHSSVSWEDNRDGLFNNPSRYHYKCTTNCGDKLTKHTYNKFHQKLSSIETNGDNTKQQITTYKYYSDGSKVLDQQPNTYELIKSATTKYQSSSGVSRNYSKSHEYDEWGNVLVEIDVHGVRTVSEYYPPEGGDGCPAHPYGMVAYVKQRSYISSDGSLKKSFSYTYQSIPKIGGGSMIVPASQVYGKRKETYTYYDSTDTRLQGLQKSKTITVNDKRTTKTTSYEFPDNNTLRITETVTSHDGLSTSTSTTHSYWNGLIKQEANEAGIVTKYTHYNSGRTQSVTTGVDTDYEVTTNYQYIHNPPVDPLSSDSPHVIGLKVIQETTSGTTAFTFYDGEEKELTTYQKDKYGNPRKLSEKNYDEQGRIVSHVLFDYIISEEADHKIEKTISEAVTTAYDNWGNKCELRHSDGTSQLSIRDPISNQVSHQVVRKDSNGKVVDTLHSTKTTLNSFNKPSKVEVFDKSGDLYSTTSFEYDQFGRETKITRPTGATVGITHYDEVDRPVEFKHYDGTIMEVSYIDMSVQSLVSSITVPSMNATLGQQEYDGLSRITSKTVNGVTTQYSYKDGYKKPSRRINGRGQTLLFDYIPELDMQPSRVASFDSDVQIGNWDDTSKISESVYTYGKSSSSSVGRIMSATSPAGQYTYEYTSLGTLKTTTQVVGNKSQTVTNESTTMGGKPLSVKIGDRKITYNYDERGDVTSIIDGDIMTEVSMDEFSRVSKKVVKQYNPSSGAYDDLLQTTHTSYDEYSRETARTITVEKSGKVMLIQTSYDTEDKVVQRTMTVNDTDSLTESYSYDCKKRLVAYEVTQHTTDTLLPHNENDKPFTSQTFAFDGLDNITSIVTRFPNGNTDTATLTYDQTNKQRLIRISHTLTTGGNAYPGCITLKYDADGNIISYKDSVMTYTVSGRLATKDGTAYTYDAFDRLVKSKKTTRVYSDHGHVVQEIDDSGTTDFLRCGNIPVGEIRNSCKKVYGVDQSFTTVSVTEDTSTSAVTYSPYGHGNNGARIGLNGELRDIGDSDVYHLGNGTRTYFPAFNGFSTADSYSPFLGGGINPYKYCGGDPINAIDPSGHASVEKIMGYAFAIILSVVGIGSSFFTAGTSAGFCFALLGAVCGVISASLGIAADVTNNRGLEITSIAVGGLGIIFNFLDIAADIYTVSRAVSTAKEIMIARKTISYPEIDVDLDKCTTGYFSRYVFTKNENRLAKEINLLKYNTGVKKVPRFTDFFGSKPGKWMKEPLRVFVNGEKDDIKLAGFWNVLSKHRMFVRYTRPAIQIIANTEDIVFSSIKAASSDSSSKEESGSEPSVTHSVQSSFGLPVNKPIHVAKLIFKY